MTKKRLSNNDFMLSYNIDDILYFGSITILYIITAYRAKIQNLEIQMTQSAMNLSLSQMIKLMQEEIIAKKQLNVLNNFMKESLCKPPISNLRFNNWFFCGETIVCMSIQEDNNFVTPILATVRSMRYFSDGTCNMIIVVNEQDDFLCKKGCKFGVYNSTSPFVIKQWEYNYLMRDFQFAKQWLRISGINKIEMKHFMRMFYV